jgi:DNA-binding transcriptional LysR family regulator
VTRFEHSRTGHVLTESGRMLLKHAENVERSVSTARGELTGEPGTLSGFIRISVLEAFCTWILARHLPKF